MISINSFRAGSIKPYVGDTFLSKIVNINGLVLFTFVGSLYFDAGVINTIGMR